MANEIRYEGSANLKTNATLKKKIDAPKGIKSKLEVRKIEFNEMGMPTGIWAQDYKIYLSKTCTRKVSILYKNWNDVPQVIKDTLWEDIQREFQIDDESMKRKVLQSCAKSWRDFKNKLVRRWIKKADKASENEQLDEEDDQEQQRDPPYVVYNFISEQDWTEFVRRCTSSHFKDEWKKKQEEGEFNPTRGDNVLTRAIGKKAGNDRTLGIESGVGFRALWGTAERLAARTNTSVNEEEIAKRVFQRFETQIKSKIDAIVQERFINFVKQLGMEIPSHLLMEETTNPNTNDAPSIPPYQAEDFDPFITLKTCECQLAVMIDNLHKVIVADGTIHSSLTRDHIREVRADCIKVSVDYCYPNYTGVEVPVPTQQIKTVGMAYGLSVQWPKDLVIFDEETVLKLMDECNKRKSGRSIRAGGTPEMSNKAVGSGHASNDPNNYVLTNFSLQNVSGKCRLLTKEVDAAAANAMFNLTCTTRELGYNGTVQVTREDITQLLTGAWLNVSVIQVFIMALSEMCDTDDAKINSIGFMCPSMISHTMVKNDPDGVHQYMTNLMTTRSTTRFFLCPFYSSNHWILLVLCIHKREVYIFDSLGKKETYGIKPLLGIAFRNFRMNSASSGLKLTWKSAECAKQLDGLECGYYVIRYMLDIIQTYYGSDDLVQDYSRSTHFKYEEIEEVRDIWAEYFLSNIESIS